jgi:endoglucanase
MTRLSKVFLAAAIAVSAALPVFASPAGSPVSQYGRLFADGNRIVGERSDGETVQLKGPSLSWSVSQWGSHRFFITETVDAMVDGWNANVIRVPLGLSYEPYGVRGGYDVPDSAEVNWRRVELVADRAIERGVYVVIDWHSHNAHDPAQVPLAVDFFTNPQRAGKYGNNDAVIFQIYNEPLDSVVIDGTKVPVTWADVKAYSETVISAIRAAGFNNLIVVGSPHWTSRPNLGAADPPSDPGTTEHPQRNIAMAFHFYADDHRIDRNHWFQPGTYRDAVLNTLAAGFPVFVSEWGTNNSSITGLPNLPEAHRWITFLDSLKISACAWSAVVSENQLDFWTRTGNPLTLGPGTLANWTNPAGMTPHGRFVYRWLTGNDTTVTSDIVIGPDGWPIFSGMASPIPLTDRVWGETNSNSDGSNNTFQHSETDGVLTMTYSLVKGDYQWNPYVGVGFEADVSHCGWGLGYAYIGSAHTLRAEQSDVDDWAFHINDQATGNAAAWTEVRIPWSYFAQPGWGAPVAQDATRVTHLRWYIELPDGRSGELSVRDLRCLGDPNGEQVSVRNPGRGRQANANQFARVSGNTLRLRLATDGRVDIYTINGRRVRTMDVKRGDHNIRMNNLPRGMYVININSGASSWKQSVRMLVK